MTEYAWPAELRPSRQVFYLQPNTLRFVSPITRQTQVLRREGARWVAELTFDPLNARLAGVLEGLLAALAGSVNTVRLRDFRREFRTGDPRSQGDVPTGPFSFDDATIFTDGTGMVVGSGNPSLAAGAPRGALSIATQGWYPNAVAVGAGDYLGIAGRLEITRKLVAAMAGVLVVSGGRFFVHAGAPALPAATITSGELRGSVTVQGSRPRRDLFNGVRAVYVDPAKAWQPTDAPPLLAANYVAEDGGEAIYRDLDFPLTTSPSTVQRLMKVELERNRRQRAVTVQLNLSALRLRPWDGVMVDLDRLTPFPARVVGWRLAPEGGVDLTLAEEDAAVWDWNPATDERATGDSPSVLLPQPGVIAAPATIAVETPQAVAFAALSVAWAPVGSAYLAGYEVEFRPASVAVWQGFAGGVSAVSATIPTTEPTAFRVRAQARSGAVSGWREALVPAPPAGLTATGVAGGIQLSGSVPGGAARLQVFEAASNDLAAAVKLPAEPTALPWTRTGLATGEARWLWLRSVSPEGNLSALVGPVTATAL